MLPYFYYICALKLAAISQVELITSCHETPHEFTRVVTSLTPMRVELITSCHETPHFLGRPLLTIDKISNFSV